MPRNHSRISAGSSFVGVLVIFNAVLLQEIYLHGQGWQVFLVALPLLLLAIYSRIQHKYPLLRKNEMKHRNDSLLN